MLSGLKIKAEIEEPTKPKQTFIWTYDANTLLSYMQQVWPGVTTAQGTGTKALPYTPKTAQQWFYCAKVKGSGSSAKRFPNLTDGKVWFKVGGRYVCIDPTNFYASDYGTDGRIVTLNAPTYPNLKKAIQLWKGKGGNTDVRLTKMMRDLMAGKMVTGALEALPVLTVVLFISEVARNHTAFHTNLMALDLIQDGIDMPTASDSIIWNWDNAIWIDDACPDCLGIGTVSCGKCGGSGWVSTICRSCNGTGWFRRGIECRACSGNGRVSKKSRCRSCSGSGWFRPGVKCRDCYGYGYFLFTCNSCSKGHVRCSRCRGKGLGTVFSEYIPKGITSGSGAMTFKGGGQALQNGLLPMSHMGSAFGSAFDLTGDGAYKTVRGSSTLRSSQAPSKLMVVRRKEASVLIQWLQRVLDDSEISFSQNQTLKIATKVDKADLSLASNDFTKAYDEVTARAIAGRTLDDDKGSGDLESEVRDTVRSKIVSYLQIRAEALWYAFEH